MNLRRTDHQKAVRNLLRDNPVVAILGPRQIGKTTLARQILAGWRGKKAMFDLEDEVDRRKLEGNAPLLRDLPGLVVLDEIQHLPELFKLLRVLADRPSRPATFLVLGSASPELLRQTSETLAGRVAFYELPGLYLGEIATLPKVSEDKLWQRGGFPASFLARDDSVSFQWRRDFIRTFLQRDIPLLKPTTPSAQLERFWRMLAHWHGQLWNGAEMARSLGVTEHTARSYLDLLSQTLVLRVLQPWHENLSKRQVKSPRVYIADSGLAHALLGIHNREDLLGHPKIGASWEGFLMSQVTQRLGARREECFFWATHQGAELDLLVVRGRRRLGFEWKRSEAPGITASMRIAFRDLRLDELIVVHGGKESWPMSDNIRAVSASHLLSELKPLPV